MAHQIEELDRPMFGSNVPAWHKLGTVVAGRPTAAEALKLAALDWRVELETIFTADGIEIPGHKATVRDDLPRTDARRVLGCVSARYEPIQNVHAFDIADALAGEGGARFETAGSLRNGRIVWLLCRMPEVLRVADDKLEKYMLLSTRHDGNGPLQILFTTVRVVCWNTLSAALAGAHGPKVSIRHTTNALRRIDDARRILGLAKEHWEAENEQLAYLAGRRLEPRQARDFLVALIPDPVDPDASNARARKARESVARLYMGAQKGGYQDAVRNTAYGMLNAVAEYTDHQRTVRTTGATASKPEARMESVLWGSAADLKTQARDRLLEMIADTASSAATPAGPTADSILAGLDLN